MPSDVRDRSPSPYSRRQQASSASHRSRSPRRHPSHSRSPAEGHRYRSRSPKPRSPPLADEPKSKKKLPGGFKFKEKPQEKSQEEARDQAGRGLERGYRDRGGDPRSQAPVQAHDIIAEKFGAGASVKDKFGDVKATEISTVPSVGGSIKEDGKKEKKKKEKSKANKVQPMMEMIIVYVNDRLGTRAEIKCSSNDTISMSANYLPFPCFLCPQHRICGKLTLTLFLLQQRISKPL